MKHTKALPEQTPSEQGRESWSMLPWRKLEQHVSRLQKRIFKAQQRGNKPVVHKLQKLLLKSRAAQLLAVRRVTQDNAGKNTAGVDGVKTVPPERRLVMAEQLHPKYWNQHPARPVRRIYIPKPGKSEKRPLGIPVMQDRAHQALIKLALEPQWEALFEPNSYGFRPGRSCHDAIEAIMKTVCHLPKYVLDADIAGCFDHINHQALLAKVETFPAIRRRLASWLKAGLLDNGVFEETDQGTPQGGVISPLLANIALHGMEEVVAQAAPSRREPVRLIRYADDFVVTHSNEEVVKKAQQLLQEWLKEMGLELKASKTCITHTLKPYQGHVGFNFLGWTVRQYPVGKTHSGKTSGRTGKQLGFKTIITPSQEGVKRHLATLKAIISRNRNASQDRLIEELNPVIRGWTNYYRTVVAASTFKRCRYVLYQQLRAWAKRRHPNKSSAWIMETYWHLSEGKGWTFRSREGKTLWEHTQTKVQRHCKVKGRASPYDGNVQYWSTRLSKHPMLKSRKGKLLQRQQGKCLWCGLRFQDADLLEVDHRMPKSQGGSEMLSNLCVLHRHCHDQRHAQDAKGTYDKRPKYGGAV